MKHVLLLCALLISTIPATAAVVENSSIFEYADVASRCGLPEDVILSGQVHTLMTYTLTKKNIVGALAISLENFHGTGQTTGAEYTFSESFAQAINQSLDGTGTTTVIGTVVTLLKGPDGNYLYKGTYHVVITASGGYFVIDHLFQTCVGE